MFGTKAQFRRETPGLCSRHVPDRSDLFLGDGLGGVVAEVAPFEDAAFRAGFGGTPGPGRFCSATNEPQVDVNADGSALKKKKGPKTERTKARPPPRSRSSAERGAGLPSPAGPREELGSSWKNAPALAAPCKAPLASRSGRPFMNPSRGGRQLRHAEDFDENGVKQADVFGWPRRQLRPLPPQPPAANECFCFGFVCALPPGPPVTTCSWPPRWWCGNG